MKKLLIIPILLISLVCEAATYYLSPTGSDSNGNGTLNNPWFSINKAWTVVTSGDIVYMLGGTYNYPPQKLIGKSGTSGNYIKVWAYPGSGIPILRKSGSYANTGYPRAILYIDQCEYIHIKGLEICYNNQENSYTFPGFTLGNAPSGTGTSANNCIIEQINSHHNGGPGGSMDLGKDNLFLNCDFHDNHDPISNSPGDNSDGFGWSWSLQGGTNTVSGCRMWNNGDDGFDIYYCNGKAVVENCWAWNNGFDENGNLSGNGCAFKLNANSISQPTTVLAVIKNCIAYSNRRWGYHQNHTDGICQLFNNIAYANGDSRDTRNDEGFYFNDPELQRPHVLINNISYDNEDIANISSRSTVTTNSFVINGTKNSSYSVTDADFVSLDGSQLARPRKSDGSLPDITFLHLTSGSDLINRGIDVGLLYSGSAPDLGPFETQLTTTAAIPLYLSSVVENATPALLEMTYNMTLANTIPSVSAFSVTVNSVPRSVSAVAISGSKVQLTLTSAIKFGDIIAVSYTKPANNPLKSASGGEAISISAQSTTNNLINTVKDTTPGNITMTISPNPVHKIINIAFKYTSSALAPQIIRIFDISGKLFIEKLLVTSVANARFSINLNTGVYNVLLFSGGLQMASQKIIVRK